MLQFSKSYFTTVGDHAVKSTANPNGRVEPNRGYERRVLCLRVGSNVVCKMARADRSSRPAAVFAPFGSVRRTILRAAFLATPLALDDARTMVALAVMW